MIKFLVDIVSSKRDLNGNCYHAATITRTSDNLQLAGTIDSPGNVYSYICRAGLAAFGQNEVHETQTTLPIRQFNALTKRYKHIHGEDDVVKFFNSHERI